MSIHDAQSQLSTMNLYLTTVEHYLTNQRHNLPAGDLQQLARRFRHLADLATDLTHAETTRNNSRP